MPWSSSFVLGPLHTRAKSHNHEMVRAQRKGSNAVPRHLQNHVVWSWILKCSVQSCVTGPSTKCYFNEFLFLQVLTHNKIKQINGCKCSECHGLLVLCKVYLQEVVFENSPSDHETWSIRCYIENHVHFTSIHLAFTYAVGPSSVVGSKLGPAPPFPLMRVLGHGLSVSWGK